MTRTEAIDLILAKLDTLSDDRVEVLADIVEAFMRGVPDEVDATRATIAEGIAQADRGEFATTEEVAAAFARFSR